jgi:dCTP deaminase
VEVDTSSIDLHLNAVEEAKVWDHAAYAADLQERGMPGVLGLGSFNYRAFAARFAVPVPTRTQGPPDALVYRDEVDRIILRPHGFFLWQTREEVGTPEVDPRLICFVDGKSTRARTGLVVHMTAPTLHAGWWGKVTLEIANLGPFTLALAEGDAVAQVVVAALSSPPLQQMATGGIAVGQVDVTGGGKQVGKKGRSSRPRTRR